MDGSFDGTLGSDPVHQDRPHQWARLVDLTRFLVSKPKLLFAAQMAVAPTLPQHLKPCPMSDSQGGPADRQCRSRLHNFRGLPIRPRPQSLGPCSRYSRYYGPNATRIWAIRPGIRAAVEKRRHRSTEVRRTARRATAPPTQHSRSP
jgi:hypothetical protein